MKTSSLPQSLQHYMSRPSVVSPASTRATPGQAMSPLCAHRSCPCVCVGQCYAFEHERICRCCDVLTCNDCPSRMQDPRLQFQSSRAHLDLARACFGTTVGVPLSSHAQRRWTCPRRNIAQPAARAPCRAPCIQVGGCLGCGSGSGSTSARGASGWPSARPAAGKLGGTARSSRTILCSTLRSSTERSGARSARSPGRPARTMATSPCRPRAERRFSGEGVGATCFAPQRNSSTVLGRPVQAPGFGKWAGFARSFPKLRPEANGVVGP